MLLCARALQRHIISRPFNWGCAMAKLKAMRGLLLRNGVWHLDKQIYGKRICESARTFDVASARRLLALRTYQVREMHLYGTSFIQSAEQFKATFLHDKGAKRFRELQGNGICFKQAADRYLAATKHKRGFERSRRALEDVVPFVGELPLRRVHQQTLQPFIDSRLKGGAGPGTVNRELAVVRVVLNLASRVWRDENGFPYLGVVPFIPRLSHPYARQPYPLAFGEQAILFSELHEQLRQIGLFAVNTGLRTGEVLALRWKWEVRIPELHASMFVIPREFAKTNRSRCVFLNKAARTVIAGCRGKHSEFVFSRAGQPLKTIYNTGWRNARKRAARRYESELGRPCPAAFRVVRVHDLRHTFGHRLRAAGVGFEDRVILLGHHMDLHMGTHYSSGEVRSLIASVEKICKPSTRDSSLPIAVIRCEADGRLRNENANTRDRPVSTRPMRSSQEIRPKRWIRKPLAYRYT